MNRFATVVGWVVIMGAVMLAMHWLFNWMPEWLAFCIAAAAMAFVAYLVAISPRATDDEHG